MGHYIYPCCIVAGNANAFAVAFRRPACPAFLCQALSAFRDVVDIGGGDLVKTLEKIVGRTAIDIGWVWRRIRHLVWFTKGLPIC